ncbi:MAG: hypothetical protein HRT82_01535 [Henriciella sp.]|nr:hypothetical protein [Henriciella sp.]
MPLSTRLSPVCFTALLTAGALVLSACTTETPSAVSTDNGAEPVISRLVGHYSNLDQYKAAPDAHKIAPEIGSDAPWIDLQYAVFKRVNVPSVPGDVIALEWRSGAKTGPISRQRLWAFRASDAGLVMDFYTLTSEIEFSSAEAFLGLQLDDLISYGNACALPVHAVDGGFAMAIPETCQIVSRSGRDMTLSAQISIGDTLTYQESGRFPNGDLVFQVPGIGPYQFTRLTE